MDKKYKVSSDSEGLGSWGVSGFVVGYVAEVNGPEACEIPEFTPTKHEVIQTAKYWYERMLAINIFYFTVGQAGSTEWRVNRYADRRIGRAAEILTEEELNELLADVERDFKEKRKISDEDWNIFKNGSQEEWAAHQDQVYQELELMNEQPKSDPPERK